MADRVTAENLAATRRAAARSGDDGTLALLDEIAALRAERDAAAAREAAYRAAIAAVVQATVWEDGPQEDGTWAKDAAACVHPAALVPLPGLLADPSPAAKRHMARVEALERLWRASREHESAMGAYLDAALGVLTDGYVEEGDPRPRRDAAVAARKAAIDALRALDEAR